MRADLAGWWDDPVTVQRLARRVVADAGRVRAWPLAGGISAQTVAVEVGREVESAADQAGSEDDRSRFVVRVPTLALSRDAHDAAAREYAILALLDKVGVAAPRPRLLDESTTILPVPYLVMSYIPGRLDFTRAGHARAGYARAYVEQMAAQLARVHDIAATEPTATDPTATDPTATDPTATDLTASDLTVQNLPTIDAALDSLLAPRASAELNHALDEPRLRTLLAKARPTLARNAPVLLHGDFWPGNLLWQTDAQGLPRLAGVVDWEDVARGDPLADLAISRLDLTLFFGPDRAAAFTAAYRVQKPQLDYTALPWWDLFAALRAVSWLLDEAVDWAQLGRADVTAAHKQAMHAQFIEQALANTPI